MTTMIIDGKEHVVMPLEVYDALVKSKDFIEQISKRLLKPIASKKEVADILNRSTRTVNRYMEEGLLIEGVHYVRKNDKMVTFIEDAILSFRDELERGLVK